MSNKDQKQNSNMKLKQSAAKAKYILMKTQGTKIRNIPTGGTRRHWGRTLGRETKHGGRRSSDKGEH